MATPRVTTPPADTTADQTQTANAKTKQEQDEQNKRKAEQEMSERQRERDREALQMKYHADVTAHPGFEVLDPSTVVQTPNSLKSGLVMFNADTLALGFYPENDYKTKSDNPKLPKDFVIHFKDGAITSSPPPGIDNFKDVCKEMMWFAKKAQGHTWVEIDLEPYEITEDKIKLMGKAAEEVGIKLEPGKNIKAFLKSSETNEMVGVGPKYDPLNPTSLKSQIGKYNPFRPTSKLNPFGGLIASRPDGDDSRSSIYRQLDKDKVEAREQAVNSLIAEGNKQAQSKLDADKSNLERYEYERDIRALNKQDKLDDTAKAKQYHASIIDEKQKPEKRLDMISQKLDEVASRLNLVEMSQDGLSSHLNAYEETLDTNRSAATDALAQANAGGEIDTHKETIDDALQNVVDVEEKMNASQDKRQELVGELEKAAKDLLLRNKDCGFALSLIKDKQAGTPADQQDEALTKKLDDLEKKQADIQARLKQIQDPDVANKGKLQTTKEVVKAISSKDPSENKVMAAKTAIETAQQDMPKSTARKTI